MKKWLKTGQVMGRLKARCWGWILRHRIDGEDNRALGVDDKISRRMAN